VKNTILNNMTQEELQKKIANNEVSLEYYSPSESKEWYDPEEDCYYNRNGNRLRHPSEYNQHSEGYTPFGDE
jgi:hypothetical protein